MNTNFNPELIYDVSSNSYTITIKTLGAKGSGSCLEKAAEMLIDEIDSLALAFFDSPEYYTDKSHYEDYYDYFIGISRFTKNDFIQLLEVRH